MKKQRNHHDLFDRDSVRAIRIIGKLICYYDLEPTYRILLLLSLRNLKNTKIKDIVHTMLHVGERIIQFRKMKSA